jgi:hypothetical protein
MEPPEEEDRYGSSEDVSEQNEGACVIADVVVILYECQNSKSSDNGGEGAQKNVRRAEVAATLARQHPHTHRNHHHLGENRKRQIR